MDQCYQKDSETQRVNLNWSHHSTILNKRLENLLQKKMLTDCIIVTADKVYFEVHKVIMACCSHYFENILDYCGPKPVIVLKDIHSENLRAIIDFIYTGNVTLLESEIIGFFDAVKHLEIVGHENLELENLLQNYQIPEQMKNNVGKLSSLSDNSQQTNTSNWIPAMDLHDRVDNELEEIQVTLEEQCILPVHIQNGALPTPTKHYEEEMNSMQVESFSASQSSVADSDECNLIIAEDSDTFVDVESCHPPSMSPTNISSMYDNSILSSEQKSNMKNSKTKSTKNKKTIPIPQLIMYIPQEKSTHVGNTTPAQRKKYISDNSKLERLEENQLVDKAQDQTQSKEDRKNSGPVAADLLPQNTEKINKSQVFDNFRFARSTENDNLLNEHKSLPSISPPVLNICQNMGTDVPAKNVIAQMPSLIALVNSHGTTSSTNISQTLNGKEINCNQITHQDTNQVPGLMMYVDSPTSSTVTSSIPEPINSITKVGVNNSSLGLPTPSTNISQNVNANSPIMYTVHTQNNELPVHPITTVPKNKPRKGRKARKEYVSPPSLIPTEPPNINPSNHSVFGNLPYLVNLSQVPQNYNLNATSKAEMAPVPQSNVYVLQTMSTPTTNNVQTTAQSQKNILNNTQNHPPIAPYIPFTWLPMSNDNFLEATHHSQTTMDERENLINIKNQTESSMPWSTWALQNGFVNPTNSENEIMNENKNDTNNETRPQSETYASQSWPTPKTELSQQTEKSDLAMPKEGEDSRDTENQSQLAGYEQTSYTLHPPTDVSETSQNSEVVVSKESEDSTNTPVLQPFAGYSELPWLPTSPAPSFSGGAEMKDVLLMSDHTNATITEKHSPSVTYEHNSKPLSSALEDNSEKNDSSILVKKGKNTNPQVIENPPQVIQSISEYANYLKTDKPLIIDLSEDNSLSKKVSQDTTNSTVVNLERNSDPTNSQIHPQSTLTMLSLNPATSRSAVIEPNNKPEQTLKLKNNVPALKTLNMTTPETESKNPGSNLIDTSTSLATSDKEYNCETQPDAFISSCKQIPFITNECSVTLVERCDRRIKKLGEPDNRSSNINLKCFVDHGISIVPVGGSRKRKHQEPKSREDISPVRRSTRFSRIP